MCKASAIMYATILAFMEIGMIFCTLKDNRELVRFRFEDRTSRKQCSNFFKFFFAASPPTKSAVCYVAY